MKSSCRIRNISRIIFLMVFLCSSGLLIPCQAWADAQSPFVGEIIMLPSDIAPAGWALCNGQIIPISQNTALFAILGTTYGGDGKSNFALPDLQGRIPIHAGQGPGLGNYDLGQTAGSETVTLLTSEMPNHTHSYSAVAAAGNSAVPGVGKSFAGAATSDRKEINLYTSNADSTLGMTGGSQPHNNMQPYLVVNYCIALHGDFPPL